MASISLESYLVKVNEKNTDKSLDFNNIGSENISLNEIILDYLDTRRQGKLIESTEKLLQIQEYDFDGGKEFIRGRLERGAYGFSSKIINIESNVLKYDKAANEAEMLPFYFLTFLPNSYNRGLLLLQTFGQYGFKTDLEKDLNDYVSEVGLNIKIIINSLAPKKVIENYLEKGSIKKMRLIKYNLPDDITDWQSQDRFEDECYMEVSINAKKQKNINYYKNGILKLINREIENDELVEIEGFNFDYDEVKVELKVGKKRRTINLTDTTQVRGKFDVTEQVNIMDSGHPTYESIDREAEGLILDLGKGIGII